MFPYIGNFIIPIDFHIFQSGRYTTNQLWYWGNTSFKYHVMIYWCFIPWTLQWSPHYNGFFLLATRDHCNSTFRKKTHFLLVEMLLQHLWSSIFILLQLVFSAWPHPRIQLPVTGPRRREMGHSWKNDLRRCARPRGAGVRIHWKWSWKSWVFMSFPMNNGDL